MNNEERAAYKRAWYKKNKARLREKQKAYEAENPERVKRNRRAYRTRHKEKILAKGRAYRATPAAKEVAKNWRESNRDQRLAYRRELYAKNAKAIAAKAAEKRATPAGREKNTARKMKYTADRREWMAKNPEMAKERRRLWRENSKISTKAYRLKAKYGLTLEQYHEMLLAQNNRCAICKTDTPMGHGKVFVVDHCHATNKVRQLLCVHCNAGLGHFKDSPWILEAAANYLRQHGKQP